MIWETLVIFVHYFVLVFNFLLLARILLSWVPQVEDHPIARFLIEVTEPILAPVRKLLPKGWPIDLSPLVTIFLMQALQALLDAWLSRL